MTNCRIKRTWPLWAWKIHLAGGDEYVKRFYLSVSLEEDAQIENEFLENYGRPLSRYRYVCLGTKDSLNIRLMNNMSPEIRHMFNSIYERP